MTSQVEHIYSTVNDAMSTGRTVSTKGTIPGGSMRDDRQGKLHMRTAPTFTAFEPGRSPYEQFSQGDNVSLDDGINMDSPGSSEKDQGEYAIPYLPQSSDIYTLFEEYMEVMSPMADSEQQNLREQSQEAKCKIINNQKPTAPKKPALKYVHQLERYISSNSQKRRLTTKRGNKEALSELSFCLRRLKMDLKMGYPNFAEEFVVTHKGVSTLVNTVSLLQQDRQTIQTNKKNKQEAYKQFMIDEYDCLLCIKFAIKAQMSSGLKQLLQKHHVVDNLLGCTLFSMNNNNKAQIVALQLLTMICASSNTIDLVMKASGQQRKSQGEDVRFQSLVQSVDNSHDIHLQIACMKFLNQLVSSTENSNARVYLQYELQLAGHDPESMDKIIGAEVEHLELQSELEVWRQNYVNLAAAKQDMLALENRNIYLRQEVDRQTGRIQELERHKSEWVRTEADLKERCEKYREKAAEMQDLAEKLDELYKKNTGHKPAEEGVDAGEEAHKPIDIYATQKRQEKHRPLNRTDTATSLSSVSTDDSSTATYDSQDPPLTLFNPMSFIHRRPEAPLPPPVPENLSRTVRRKITTKVNMPLLNWTPINNTKSTLFEEIDDEAKIREIDFTAFERLFRLADRIENRNRMNKWQKNQEKIKQMILFIDPNRARNMIITLKRTKIANTDRKWTALKQAVNSCDTERLPGEYAELLLKYVPTKDELKSLAEHRNDYHKMGEAEQLLFQMTQISRLEKKLTSMAFMGVFKELTTGVRPQVESVYTSSLSVRKSVKFKKILEIILAYGNYMNSRKRGYAFGFRVESLLKLQDVRSTDKKYNMLNYLVEVIEKDYPELSDFYTELHITVEKGVSFQAIASDVQGLRKGLDLIRYEREKESDNAVIEAFYTHAVGTVSEIAESFHRMEEAYQAVCKMFGEKHKQIEPDEFFAYFTEFVKVFKEAARNNYISLHPEAAKEPGPSEHEARLKMSMVANDVAQEANRRSQLTSSTDEPVVDSLIKTKLPISTENVVTPDSEKIKVRNSSENAVITATYRSEKVTNKSDEMSQEGPYSQAISKLKSPPSVRRSATFTTSERPISKVGVTRTNSKAESPNVPYEPRGTSRLFKAKSSEGGTATQAVPPRRLGSKNQDKHSSKSRHSTTSTGTRQSGESTADKNTEKKTKNKVPPLVIPDNDDENEEVFSPISAKTQFQIMEALDMLNKAVAEEDPNSGDPEIHSSRL